MTTITPARTIDQRLAALGKANRVRSARATLKRDMKAGRVTLAAMLDNEDCATMKVVDALIAMPKVGRVKAHRALSAARVSPSKTLAGMTSRQRGELLALLPPDNAGTPTLAPIHRAPLHRDPAAPNGFARGERRVERGLNDLLDDIRRA